MTTCKQQTNTIGTIIIVLTEHPTLGTLLIPYLMERIPGKDEIRLTEQAFHASSMEKEQMTAAEQKAIEIASHYTEKYLMQVYSHEKTVARFLQKLAEDPEKIKKVLRPFINKKLHEMVELICEEGLPLYQKDDRSKVLYPHHAYLIHREAVKTSFAFDFDGSSFSYEATCTLNGQPLSLTARKPVVVLTHTAPATLLMGMELFTFEQMEAARLIPFTKKKRVSVDGTQIQKYIDNIIIPIARHHDITLSGLHVIEEQRPFEAMLYPVEGLCDERLLRLIFRYADRTFLPETPIERKYFLPHKEEVEETTIRYFCRNRAAEEKAVSLLQATGLKAINESHFRLSAAATEKNLRAWIAQHRTMLQQEFRLSGEANDRPYCLDEIRLEQHYEDGPDWFELHIEVIIGKYHIPFSHFRKHILNEERTYTLPDGSLILLPEEWFSKYQNLLELGEERQQAYRLKPSLIGIATSLLCEGEQVKLPVYHPQQAFSTPPGLKAELRPYQQKGFGWLMHLYEQGFGGCLADDMGLGKTLQTLALLQAVYGTRSTVDEVQLAAPLQPVLLNEMGQFCLFGDSAYEETLPLPTPQANREEVKLRKPSTLIVMPTSLLHNWRKEAKRFTQLSMAEYNSATVFRKGHPELFFGRYHLIFTSYGMLRNHIDTLRTYCFEYVILDESQHIKNSDSLTFRAAIGLQAHHRLVLTGTPIENSLKDLWAQFHFLQPDLLGDENSFAKRYITPIRQKDNRMELRLRQLISPFILRRSKQEVAPELPPLTEEVIYCDMTDEQHRIYQQEKNSLRNTLLQEKLPHQQPLLVLNGITRLRQLACHPLMVTPDFIGESGKLEQIIDTFATLQSEGHKVLIFSSFVKHLELVADAFRQRQWSYALLTGATTHRKEEIDRFAQTDDIQAFLISLKAGGVGLNLTQADYVFIIDPWWNPAAEAQAIARAHRIGQEKQVIAYRFITQGSIEEKIVRLQEEKRTLAETFITESAALPPLTDQEWAGLLQ